MVAGTGNHPLINYCDMSLIFKKNRQLDNSTNMQETKISRREFGKITSLGALASLIVPSRIFARAQKASASPDAGSATSTTAKKVLVLMGSPRKGGNTDHLCDEFIRGAREAAHETEKIYLKDRKIGYCLGCFACQHNGGKCIQNDDMGEIYEKMKAADIIVFASPVYFYSWSAQIKTVIDRTVAIESILTNKTFYLISAGQAPEEKYMTTMIDSFRKYTGCFKADGNREGGYVFGYGTSKPGDVVGTPAMEQAYQMGRNIYK
jgi:multimeric flavodoxin WrbA